MANTGSQALAIRDLLVERLELFDPTLDATSGSPIFDQVINPVFTALGTDPFDTDIESFLKDRIRQEFPSISVTDGDAVVDLLIRPLQLLLEAFKRELQIIRLGQSVRNSASMRIADAEALAANVFVTRKIGNRASGTVRLFFAAPTFVSVLSTAVFTTASGLRFFPTRPQYFGPEVVLIQRSGTQYYVDVSVISEFPGVEYNIAAGSIARITGLGNVSRVTNLFAFTGGGDEETASELLSRASKSLTERSLNTRRGIAARLFEEFPTLRNLEVVGKGDPEMNRDILTGRGHGRVVAAGVCFIVGQFAFMFSQYEDRGEDGTVRISEGNEIELNYWSFLYDTLPEDRNEKFTVEDIIFDSRDLLAENLPSMLLFRLSGTPSALPPIASTLPGVLPGVFCVVRTMGVLEISDIPGGITNPDTARGVIEIEDNQVHIGGHYDIWVRPGADTQMTTEPGTLKSETSYLEGNTLYTGGSSPVYKNIVHETYQIRYTAQVGSLQIGELLRGENSRALALLVAKSTTLLTLACSNGVEIEAGETLVGRATGAQVTADEVLATSFEKRGVRKGMLLTILDGGDAGTYKILKVVGPFLWIDVDLTLSETGLLFRVLDEVVLDLYSPKEVVIPHGTAKGEDLKTAVGSATVRTTVDLLTFGAKVGDTFQILDREDEGTYTIVNFDSALGGTAPVLSSPMSTTNSSVMYQVFRSGVGLQSPILRIRPSGAVLLDGAGQDSGYVVPYALPVEGRALEAFCGARAIATGKNGFVLADPGQSFEPEGNVEGDPAVFADVLTAYSDEYLTCGGFIAVATLMSDESFYIDAQLPAAAKLFLQGLREWLVNVVSAFGLGMDVESFVNGFHPFILDTPTVGTVTIISQFEICLPSELFDGCNNVFVGIPEFDFESEFSDPEMTFSDAMDGYNNGTIEGAFIPPALAQAKPGHVLTLRSGANAGSYLIDKVVQYKIGHGGVVAQGDPYYSVTVVTIAGSFPVASFSGLREFFANGVPAVGLPLPGQFDVEAIDTTTGNKLSPFEYLQKFVHWIFRWLDSMGFDLPDSFTLEPGEVLKAVWLLLFTEYEVGEPTSDQIVRLAFLEPTTLMVQAPMPCVGYSWRPPVIAQTPELVGLDFTVPLNDLATVLSTLEIVDSLGSKVISAEISAAAAAATTISALATQLQADLDPIEGFVVFSGPATMTGALTVTAQSNSEGLTIDLDATDIADAYRALGFFDGTGKKWSFMYNQETPADNYRDLIFSAPSGVALQLSFTTAGILDIEALFPAGTYTWQGIADEMTTQMTAGLVAVVAASTVTVTMIAAGERFVLGVAIVLGPSDTFNAPMIFAAPSVGVNKDAAVFGVGADWYTTPGTAGVSSSVKATIGTLTLTVDIDGFPTTLTKSWASFAEYAATTIADGLQHAIDFPAGVDRFSYLAKALNNDVSEIYSDGERRVWFVGGDRLDIRAVAGGATTTLSVDPTTGNGGGYQLLGFTNGTTYGKGAVLVDWVGGMLTTTGSNPASLASGQGSVEPGELVQDLYEPPSPTLFSVAAGGGELLFAPSPNIDIYQVFPGGVTGSRTPSTELPRDIGIDAAYTGMLSTVTRYSDTTYPAPVEIGIEVGSDILYLYEQRKFLESTSTAVEVDLVRDRVVAVQTSFGSNKLKLPDISTSTENFNFQDSMTDEPDDEVQVGDIIFIEEGNDTGGYVVTARDEHELTIDTAMTEGSGKVYRAGNDGIIEAGTVVLRSDTASFTTDDIGRYLTIWAMDHVGYDGSYRITAVDALGTHTEATLDTDDFLDAELDIHWAVVKAPSEDPDSSGTEGRTALVGLRPIRVYNGTPSQWRVAAVSGGLRRDLATVTVALEDTAVSPKVGIKQPYEFVRPGVQVLTSTAMANQGRELGLYYMDVLSKSMGSSDAYNLAEGTRLEPVFGTFQSEGYRLETEDNRLSFSTEETLKMVMTPMFLPKGLEPLESNRVSLNGKGLRLTYDYAPVVGQIQRLATSEADRILCASPLTRHFLPSYVYLDIDMSGGNSADKIAADLVDYIESLEPVDVLSLSALEGVIHANNVTSYEHPISLITVTHDLDRRVVAIRSQNRIDDSEAIYNGTNRTSFFIPGTDVSGKTEAEIADGERIKLNKAVAPPFSR